MHVTRCILDEGLSMRKGDDGGGEGVGKDEGRVGRVGGGGYSHMDPDGDMSISSERAPSVTGSS